MEYKLFCDLDGVLADFNKGYLNLTGIDISKMSFQTGAKFWKPIDDAGEKFWSELEWMEDGEYLWNCIRSFNLDPVILSAPSKQKSSIIGKQKWVKRELKGVPLILKNAKQKQHFAAPNHILIDDRLDNCERWTHAGGISINHINAPKTVLNLLEIIS